MRNNNEPQSRKRVLAVGIMPRDQYQKRVMAIARGDYKPKPHEPKVWFASLQALAQVLNQKNMELLKVIADHQPASVSDLARQTGRHKSNLSRTLKTLANYQLIGLERGARSIRPVARYDEIDVRVGL